MIRKRPSSSVEACYEQVYSLTTRMEVVLSDDETYRVYFKSKVDMKPLSLNTLCIYMLYDILIVYSESQSGLESPETKFLMQANALPLSL